MMAIGFPLIGFPWIGFLIPKFLITVPHYNFCIVHCDQGVCISYVADIVHFGKAVGQQQQQQVQQQICPSWTSVYQSDRLWFVQAAE